MFYPNHLRYNIKLLSRRFAPVTDRLAQQPETMSLKVGHFGSNTAGAAARLDLAKAIVKRGAQPDLDEESAC